MYIIDSDILVFLDRGRVNIQERIYQAGISNCFVSEISLAELYVGAYKGRDAKMVSFLTYVEKMLGILPISSVIPIYAKLRAGLDLQGNRLDNMDLFIAATALANNCTLVTHNTRHFARIPGLRLEDWVEE